jgi:hypothetical protein
MLVALLLSLSMHALLMWLPPIQLPQPEPDLPPLVAQLIALPQVTHVAARPAAPKRNASRPAAPAVPATADSIASAVPATEIPQIASAVAASTAPKSDMASASAAEPAPTLAEAAPPPRPLLPKRAFLKFQVRIGKDGMAVGEARHELSIEDGRYALTATTRTVGLARLVKSYTLVQNSRGTTDGILLHPESYSEDKEDGGKQQVESVQLDYAARKLLFSSGSKKPLTEPTQDILSILYQFPPLPAAGDVLPISITNGRDWERYRFEIVTNEELITPLGKLHTVHFRKLHPPGKEGLEIWFAQEYRLLPVKLRHLSGDGSIAGEAVITDIRIAED